MERERTLATMLTVFFLLLWLGFLVHRDPSFAGSLVGGILAVTGSLLLLVPLLYSAIKRIPRFKSKMTSHVPFQTWLRIHIYAGILGGILVILHTGHRFEGPLATTLTTVLVLEIVSGFVGRYILVRSIQEVSEKKRLKSTLETRFETQASAIQRNPQAVPLLGAFSGFISRLFAPSFLAPASQAPAVRQARAFLELAESLSDVEYAIKTHELFKRIFSRWLKFHIALSAFFYALLIFHIGGEVYFGLRWFQ
jgi:hypothetical protein